MAKAQAGAALMMEARFKELDMLLPDDEKTACRTIKRYMRQKLGATSQVTHKANEIFNTKLSQAECRFLVK